MRRDLVIVLTAVALLAVAPAAVAQYSIVDSSPIVEAVTGFTGAGFTPTPAAGQLDSDMFAITGMSDGDLAFGGTITSGDYARGASAGGVSTGGVYGWSGGPDTFLFIQPGGSDFTPGTLTMRYVNNSGVTITDVDVSYSIMVLNDAPRANSWNFGYSPGCLAYNAVPALDYTTPEAADALGWGGVSRFTTLSGLSIPDGGLLCIQFSSNDVTGADTRDEIGIDHVYVTATNVPVELQSFDIE